MKYKSTRFDLYALPEGGVAGKDEFPLHEEINHLNIYRELLTVDMMTVGSHYLEAIPIQEKFTIDLLSMGSIMRERLCNVGSEFTLTILEGHAPSVISYKALLTQYDWNYPFSNEVEYQYHFVVTKQIKGGYDVEVPYARVQYDQGDGTFLEWQKYNKVKIDTLLNNRYNRW